MIFFIWTINSITVAPPGVAAAIEVAGGDPVAAGLNGKDIRPYVPDRMPGLLTMCCIGFTGGNENSEACVIREGILGILMPERTKQIGFTWSILRESHFAEDLL